MEASFRNIQSKRIRGECGRHYKTTCPISASVCHQPSFAFIFGFEAESSSVVMVLIFSHFLALLYSLHEERKCTLIPMYALGPFRGICVQKINM